MVVRADCGKYGVYDVFWTLPPRIENRDVNQLLFSRTSVNVSYSDIPAGKSLFEIVEHVGRVFGEVSVSMFERWRQYVNGKWKGSSFGDPVSGLLYSSKIRW